MQWSCPTENCWKYFQIFITSCRSYWTQGGLYWSPHINFICKINILNPSLVNSWAYTTRLSKCPNCPSMDHTGGKTRLGNVHKLRLHNYNIFLHHPPPCHKLLLQKVCTELPLFDPLPLCANVICKSPLSNLCCNWDLCAINKLSCYIFSDWGRACAHLWWAVSSHLSPKKDMI